MDRWFYHGKLKQMTKSHLWHISIHHFQSEQVCSSQCLLLLLLSMTIQMRTERKKRNKNQRQWMGKEKNVQCKWHYITIIARTSTTQPFNYWARCYMFARPACGTNGNFTEKEHLFLSFSFAVFHWIAIVYLTLIVLFFHLHCRNNRYSSKSNRNKSKKQNKRNGCKQ